MTANPLSTIPPIGPTTGMPMPQQTGKFKPVDPAQLLRQHALKLIIVGVLGAVLGGVICKVLQRISPEYTSQASFVVSAQLRSGTDMVSLRGSSGEETSIFIANKVAEIETDEILQNALLAPVAQATSWFRRYQDDPLRAAEDLRNKHLEVRPKKGTAMIQLSVSMEQPEDAQNILLAVTEYFLQNERIRSDQYSRDMTRSVQSQIDQSDEELDAKTREMQRFLQDQDLASLQAQNSDADIEFRALTQQQLLLKQQLNASEASFAAAQQLEGEAPDRAMSENEESYIRSLPQINSREERLRLLREELAVLEAAGKGPLHPQVQAAQQRTVATEAELASAIAEELPKLRALQLAQNQQLIEGLSSQLGEVGTGVIEARARLADVTQRLERYANLASQKTNLESRLSKLQNDLADARLLIGRDDFHRIKLGEAPTSSKLTSPLLKTWVPLGAFLAVGSLGGVLFLRELMDQRVKSPADLKLLPDVNLLGLIPHTSEDPSGHRQAECVVEDLPTGLMAESFRQVRTAVLSKMDRRGYKTLLLVAAQPGAGASSLTQNLAVSLALNGHSVLIIDTNFRRPRQHTLIDAANDQGLVDVLRDGADANDLIVRHPELSLAVMPTGMASESPPELLEGAAFRGFLGRMESEFDFVLIDTSPALLTSDSQLLAKHVDAIALVVDAGNDKRGMLGRMLGRLDGQRADVLGVILNGVKTSAGGYFRKSYEAFYNYRGEGDRPIDRSTRTSRDLELEPARDSENRLASDSGVFAASGAASDPSDAASSNGLGSSAGDSGPEAGSQNGTSR